MSYGVMAYLVDTEELLKLSNFEKPKKSILSIFTSGKSAYDDILNKYKNELDDLDENIRESAEDDDSIESPIFSREVLGEFFKSNISNNAFCWVYAYIFEILCKHLGVYLDNSEWCPCSSEDYDSIPFTTTSLPIKFPIPDDFPGIMFIDHKSINLEQAEYENMDNEQLEQLKGWLNQAITKNIDIYLFYY